MQKYKNNHFCKSEKYNIFHFLKSDYKHGYMNNNSPSATTAAVPPKGWSVKASTM
jgi:hypothetical protein